MNVSPASCRSGFGLWSLLTVVLAALVSSVSQPVFAQSVVRAKRLLGYYAEWSKYNDPAYSAEQIPYHKLTHIAHAFLRLDGKADGTLELPAGMIEAALISKAHAAGVKVLVSIGGGNGIQGPRFNRMAAVGAYRRAFSRNVHAFLRKYGYDGVDIDWEVPNAEDRQHCTALMRELRHELPAPRWLITMATPSDPRFRGVGFDIPALAPLVDFMNVMTYDVHGPWSGHSGHNSPLIQNPNDPDQAGSLKTSMDLYEKGYGVQPDKLNIGTGFYGYEFDGVSGLWQHCSDCETTWRAYGTYIKFRIDRRGWNTHFDDGAKAPYLLNVNIPGFITYDDAATTARKTRYVLKTRGFGGVFMWEISGDYDGHSQDLLSAMYRAMRPSQ
jgi:chitinase